MSDSSTTTGNDAELCRELLTFEPLLRRIRWGGRRLGTELQKPIGPETDYAESWEISDQPGFESMVARGRLAGQSLPDVMNRCGARLMGTGLANADQFPLLIKYLDANDWLSLQVHPNDEQAKAYGPGQRGKTEAWVILDALPDSRICAGLKPGVTREDLVRHLDNGTVEELLHMIPARPGDCVFVPAGTVHALGPGILLAEVQQQSNLTFRLYDWGRVDTDGRPRELHIEDALACIDFERGPVDPVRPVLRQRNGHEYEELVRCPHFVILRHQAAEPFAVDTEDRFRILMVLEGDCRIVRDDDSVPLSRGQTLLVPASAETVSVIPAERATLLEVFCPAE